MKTLATRATMLATAMVIGMPLASAQSPSGSIPGDVKHAIEEYVLVDPKDEPASLEALKIQSADITGDSKPEYLIQTKQEGGSDGISYCTKMMFSTVNASYDLVGTFDCCDLRMVPASTAKGGQLVCFDATDHPGQKRPRSSTRKVIFEWKGSFPKGAKQSAVSLSQVRSDFAKGKQLFGADKYAEAEPLLCSYLKMPGAPLPEYATGCGAARLGLGKYDAAYDVLSDALVNHEDYAPLQLQLGKAEDARHNAKAAVAHYSAYLKTAPAGPARSAIESRVRALSAAK